MFSFINLNRIRSETNTTSPPISNNGCPLDRSEGVQELHPPPPPLQPLAPPRPRRSPKPSRPFHRLFSLRFQAPPHTLPSPQH
ncbi:hypothetical protein Syun_015221 [Stephania yunnanensis]|uniref:Uncharacterized protein n=1 Tax=Stephania yunnanensis TaxID=152371 RepID=A0AAP0JKR2_9MAGN